jgi:hypothetical protein
MQDISGSHVMRSLLCVLSGRQVVQDKRGKNSKHRDIWQQQSKNATSGPEGKLGAKDGSKNTKAPEYRVPEIFTEVRDCSVSSGQK